MHVFTTVKGVTKTEYILCAVIEHNARVERICKHVSMISMISMMMMMMMIMMMPWLFSFVFVFKIFSTVIDQNPKFFLCMC